MTVTASVAQTSVNVQVIEEISSATTTLVSEPAWYEWITSLIQISWGI